MAWKPLGGTPPNLAAHLARKASYSAPETYGPERYMPTAAAAAFSGKVSARRPSAPIRLMSEPPAWAARPPRAGEDPASRPEDREVRDPRRTGGDAGQAAGHVGVPDVNRFLGRDRSAEAGEDVGEDLLQAFGVRAAVVDRGGRRHAQLVVGELGCNRALEDVIVGGA